MASEVPGVDTQEITITLPKAVWARLNELVPPLQHSRFIAEILEERLALEEERLALEEQRLAVDEAKGARSDENHPGMLDDAAIARLLDMLRSSWRRPG